VETRVVIALAGIAALAVGLAFFAAYQPLLAARAGEGEESVELRSVSDRIVFINFALRSISERPVLGVGIGNFPWRTSYYLAETTFALRGDNVHFVLLAAAAELGLVGLGLLVTALGAGVVAVVKGLRAPIDAENTLDARAARLAFFVVFVALTAVGVLDHYPWSQLQFQVAWWGSLAAAMPRAVDQPRIAERGDRQ
jgi:O-antigen ligase